MIEKINPDRALFVARTSEGWIVGKPSKFNIVFDEDGFKHYEINHSIFYMAKVSEELINELKMCLPTEEQLDDKDWMDKHHPKVLNFFD